MSSIKLDIVSSSESLFSGEVEMVSASGVAGELGIYPNHTPLLTLIAPGEVRYKQGGEQKSMYVSGGILEVQPHHVTILADTAIRAKELDEAKILQAKESAEKELESQRGDIDMDEVKARLSEMTLKLKLVRKYKNK